VHESAAAGFFGARRRLGVWFPSLLFSVWSDTPHKKSPSIQPPPLTAVPPSVPFSKKRGFPLTSSSSRWSRRRFYLSSIRFLSLPFHFIIGRDHSVRPALGPFEFLPQDIVRSSDRLSCIRNVGDSICSLSTAPLYSRKLRFDGSDVAVPFSLSFTSGPSVSCDSRRRVSGGISACKTLVFSPVAELEPLSLAARSKTGGRFLLFPSPGCVSTRIPLPFSLPSLG